MYIVSYTQPGAVGLAGGRGRGRARALPGARRCGGLPASPGDAFALLGPSRAVRCSAVPFGAGAAREEDGCGCSGFALGSSECRLFRVPSARVVRRLDASPAVAALRRRAVRRDMAAVGAVGAARRQRGERQLLWAAAAAGWRAPAAGRRGGFGAQL